MTLRHCAFRQLNGTIANNFHIKVYQKYSHESQFGHSMNQCSVHMMIARKLFPNAAKLTKI